MGCFLGEVQVAEGTSLSLRVLLQVGVDRLVVLHEGLGSAYCAHVIRHLVKGSFALGEVLMREKLVVLDQLHLGHVFALVAGKLTPLHFPLILLLLLSTFEQSRGYKDHLFVLDVARGEWIP